MGRAHEIKFSRRRVTLLAGLALTVAAAPIAQADAPWTLVVVPDTQHYVDDVDNVDDFVTQMQWIADHIVPRSIAFVTHIGDIVQHGSSVTEWNRAETAMSIIDGLVPYSVSCGDHDYNTEESRSSGAPQYVARYGAARYAGRPWYGGSSPDQKSHYQIFSAGGRTFLHLNLEWEIPGTVDDPTTAMGWGRQILDSHPMLPTIVSTHSNLWDKSAQKGRTNGIEEKNSNGASAERVWSDLIANRPQVFMMVNGHSHKGSSQYNPADPSDDPGGPSTDGEYHQVSTNWHGLPVYEMLADYQDYPNGGDGWIRLITFEEGTGAGGLDRIRVETYSTTHDAYQTDSLSQFSFDLSFASRFDAIPAPLPLQRVTFSSGEDAYVWKNTPATNYGGSVSLNIDTSDLGAQQGLIRFPVDFGGSIPQGAEIVHAELRISLTDSGDGFALHRMLKPWDAATVTWDSLDNGLALGNDARATADLVTHGYLSESERPVRSIFDVTASVRAWAAGETNHGWAIMPDGSDKLILESFEGVLQPQLIVDYMPGDGGGGGGGGETQHQITVASGQDSYIWRANPAQNFGTADRVRIDSSDGQTSGSGLMPMQGLLRFELQGAVPAGATITRAELRLRLTDSGAGFRMHRMLVPWSEQTVTWNVLGAGVDDDDTDAAVEPDVITDDYLTEPAAAAYLPFEVTGAVRDWVAGQANHGWALLPLGDDKLLIESFQGTELRPVLVIDYTLSP
jgi:Calcineurin-like phosphoesterase